MHSTQLTSNRRLLESLSEFPSWTLFDDQAKALYQRFKEFQLNSIQSFDSKITTIRGLLHDRAEGLVLPPEFFVKVFYRKGKFFLLPVAGPQVADGEHSGNDSAAVYELARLQFCC